MDYIIDNWYVIFGALAVGVAFGIAIHKFVTSPSTEQLAKIREWLLFAVTEAERELGGGTGQLKLRQVYDLFIERFPWLAKVVPFVLFSTLVDDALDEMREMIAKNQAVRNHVEGGEENADQ